MAEKKRFISYLRVSTKKQGLGLDAQKEMIAGYCDDKWVQVGEFQEIESGTNNNRPELKKALVECRRRNAVLMVARMDRLGRDTEFILNVVNGDVEVVFTDFNGSKFMLTVLAAVATYERDLISQRTKDALKVARTRGKQIGQKKGYTPVDWQRGVVAARKVKARNADSFAFLHGESLSKLISEDGLSLLKVAGFLNEDGIRTIRGANWTPTAVKRVVDRYRKLQDYKQTQN